MLPQQYEFNKFDDRLTYAVAETIKEAVQSDNIKLVEFSHEYGHIHFLLHYDGGPTIFWMRTYFNTHTMRYTLHGDLYPDSPGERPWMHREFDINNPTCIPNVIEEIIRWRDNMMGSLSAAQ